jgi:hypothetical protein
MIVSKGWDHVSELQLLTGLLFIPDVICEHGEPRWNDIDRKKLIHLPELSGNPTSRAINYQIRRNSANEVMKLIFEVYLFILWNIFLHAVKSGGIGPTALLSLRRKVFCGFVSSRPGLNPRILCPAVNTLTITPPRRLCRYLSHLAVWDLRVGCYCEPLVNWPVTVSTCAVAKPASLDPFRWAALNPDNLRPITYLHGCSMLRSPHADEIALFLYEFT